GFVAFLRFYTLLRRDSWIFSYLPEDGGTNIAEPLAEKINELGGKILLGARAKKLTRWNEGWEVAYTQQSEKKDTTAYKVILAMDSPSTKKLVLNSPDLTTDEEMFWPQGLANAVIRIWFDTAPSTGAEGGIFTGNFTVHNFFWLHRIQDSYRKWHQETGGSAIEVHIYGPPRVLQEPDPVLISRAATDVLSAFPELRGHRIHQTLQRNPESHTLPE
ncbi:MAG: hypothetical protein P8Y68_20730, partial [Anaerolineales bacterium]